MTGQVFFVEHAEFATLSYRALRHALSAAGVDAPALAAGRQPADRSFVALPPMLATRGPRDDAQSGVEEPEGLEGRCRRQRMLVPVRNWFLLYAGGVVDAQRDWGHLGVTVASSLPMVMVLSRQAPPLLAPEVVAAIGRPALAREANDLVHSLARQAANPDAATVDAAWSVCRRAAQQSPAYAESDLWARLNTVGDASAPVPLLSAALREVVSVLSRAGNSRREP